MRLTGLDLFFWAAGLLGHLALLFVLWYRRRAVVLPFFTALITLGVAQTVVLYLVRHYGTDNSYSYTYWALTFLDTMLQLCVVYEVASHVFRPLDVWAENLRNSFAWLVTASVTIAFVLALLATPPARTWMMALATRGNLFAGALMSELFVAMMALSTIARFPWRTHVSRVAQGLGAYSLMSVLIETGHTYFGVGGEMPAFIALSHLRMAAYLGCVSYWIVTLWCNEQASREMTDEMREKIFTLQTRLAYDLEYLRSRTKW